MAKKTELDYDKIFDTLTKPVKKSNSNKISADKVRNRMKKVAFDVYSIDNDPQDSLWRLESNADDGKEYLVRMDVDESSEVKTASWSAVSNTAGNSITLSYNGVPVQRMAGQIFGFNNEDVGIFKRALVEKVSNDNTFKKKILDMQSPERKLELVKLFPELAIQDKQ